MAGRRSGQRRADGRLLRRARGARARDAAEEQHYRPRHVVYRIHRAAGRRRRLVWPRDRCKLMRTWALMLGGLLIWAAHFFALYGIGEFAGSSAGARATVAGLTILALGGVGIVAYRSRRRSTSDDFNGWSVRLDRKSTRLNSSH